MEDVLVKAHVFARLPSAERGNLFSNLEDMLIFTSYDLKSAPLTELHFATGPSIQRETPRGV